MVLDWNLVRTILEHVEAETFKDFLADADDWKEWTEGQKLSEQQSAKTPPEVRVVLKHVQLLEKAGYIEGVTVSESIDSYFHYATSENPSLTLDGYSLLESLRNDGFIRKMRDFAPSHSVPLTLDLFKLIAAATAKSLIP